MPIIEYTVADELFIIKHDGDDDSIEVAYETIINWENCGLLQESDALAMINGVHQTWMMT